MTAHDPAGLDTAALARRLHDLVGDERRVQATSCSTSAGRPARGDPEAAGGNACRGGGIEKHGRRRGAVAPARPSARRSQGRAEPVTGRAASPRAAPATVRREVWARDGGRCTFTVEDGRRCEGRWQLELDHVDPVALGGASRVDNLRLRCREHNLLYAEEVYGREHMARFRRGWCREPRGG